MSTTNEQVESLVENLPDEQGARLFLDRLTGEHPSVARNLTSQPGLLSDLLTLASWSPLLATTLERNPDYISWLSRERHDPRVGTAEEFRESLGRFAMTRSALNPQVLLAHFRRRELLRIYLHDIRRTQTIVETTEELSNLADSILEYALSLARQDLDNKYGAPLFRDERDRIAPAEFCIVGLGKLGSFELNYASDIDLLFLYSDDGETSGSGTRGKITNREYFCKLAETITRLVGQQTGEAAAYRVDLRLRPFGRDGALAVSLSEAVRYYRETAQRWELQTLIRSRAAAGVAALYARFANPVRSAVFRADLIVGEALASVRLAKQKIDRKVESQARGFNVKLGRGGIREIEFIAQALQLAHGGNDRWLRGRHTLIVIGRLADRALITDQERTELSSGYEFLRRVEHRVQMEQGLQTHIISDDPQRRELLARRMDFAGEDALDKFKEALESHTGNVHRAYERVFRDLDDVIDSNTANSTRIAMESEPTASQLPAVEVAETAAALAAARYFAPHFAFDSRTSGVTRVQTISQLIQTAVAPSLNPQRSALLLSRVAESLHKSTPDAPVSKAELSTLAWLCGESELFGAMIASHPALLSSLRNRMASMLRNYQTILRSSIESENDFSAELSALRRTWPRMLLEIGMRDASKRITVAEANRLQTELATASMNIAYMVARREVMRRYGKLKSRPRLAILGLGRLGSGGLDYGSDLDTCIVYDSLSPSPVAELTPDEAYAHLGELIVSVLSSITRDGHLYRVDLRLRPDGNNGPIVSSSQAFLDYLKQRSAIWEWLAYVKVRAVAGDLELGRTLETQAREVIHQRAVKVDPKELQSETRHVRSRLEKEKVKRNRQGGLEIKYGPGGMLDVYFAARYLQLRDDVRDEGEARSTGTTLNRLREVGSLNAVDYEALSNGYTSLRVVDHHLRLIAGRSARLPTSGHANLRDVAKKSGYDSPAAMIAQLSAHMKTIREAFDRITQD